MVKTVILSEKSQALIKRYKELGCFLSNAEHSSTSNVDADVLIDWLNNEVATPIHKTQKEKQEQEFIVASLRAELLRDLLLAQGLSKEEFNKEEKSHSATAKVKFFLLAISGALFAACEGFDSITTILVVFSLPSVVTLVAGLLFSALSVAVFSGFNLVQVSKNLGVTLADAPKLLDLYVLQMNEIKGLRKKIRSYKLAALSTAELEYLVKLISMLQQRFDSLVHSCKQFEVALNSAKIQAVKTLFGALSGILFFGSGFFAAQSVAVFFLSLAIAGGVSAGSAPVILFSVVIGCAAFSIYWYVEKVGLQQLISGWFGLDEEKVSELCEQEKLDEQAQELNNLKEQVEATIVLTRKLDALKPEIFSASGDDDFILQAPPKIIKENIVQPIVGTNIYTFYQPAKLELCLDEQQPSVIPSATAQG